MNHLIRMLGSIFFAVLGLLLALNACSDSGQNTVDSSLPPASLPTVTSVPPASADPEQNPSSQSEDTVSSLPASSGDTTSTGSSPSSGVENDKPLENAVFIGDFATQQLRYYMTGQTERRDKLEAIYGIPQFLSSDKLGCVSALWPVTSDSVHPSWQGSKMSLEDALAKIEPDKLYLMLGFNDLAVYGVEDTYANFCDLLERLQEVLPQAEIYVQSVLPMSRGKEPKQLNNLMVADYNARLKAFCTKNGYSFLDLASGMSDLEGYLLSNYYCSGGDTTYGTPLTDDACQQWLSLLREHAIHSAKEPEPVSSAPAVP